MMRAGDTHLRDIQVQVGMEAGQIQSPREE